MLWCCGGGRRGAVGRVLARQGGGGGGQGNHTPGSSSTSCTDALLLQDFADPIANTFNYPTNAGISFSFTDSGYFEQAQCAFQCWWTWGCGC